MSSLIDELHVLTFPVVVGGGKRLFESSAGPNAFALKASRVTSKGTLIASYQPLGTPLYGSFSLAEDTSSHDIVHQ